MGFPKVRLRWGKRYLYEVLVSRFAPHAREVLLVTSDEVEVPAVPAGVAVATDLVEGAGPLGGIYTALAQAGTEFVFTLAVDLPFADPRFLSLASGLVERGEEFDLYIPFSGGKYHPLHALYRRECAARMREIIETGERRAQRVVDYFRSRVISEEELVKAGISPRTFTNINTPDEYRALREFSGISDCGLRNGE
ncbi:MAG: molybdenum cofactor guanylyltransferase [Deltaproteobacteria bacterium]|nr:MAG: molybdenum cofactor guanylyltransferase [Deltaproteobacteria bacterium]